MLDDSYRPLKLSAIIFLIFLSDDCQEKNISKYLILLPVTILSITAPSLRNLGN